MRRLVVGDIHGGHKALKQVLKRSNFSVTKDKIIFLGDYCDGWSQTSEVLQQLIVIKELTRGKENEAVFLLGNHDEWALDWLMTGVTPWHWLGQGGKATYDSMVTWFEQFPEDRDKFMEFLRSCNNYYITHDDIAFVHGGFVSREGLGHDEQHIYLWDRSLWEMAKGFKVAYMRHVDKWTGPIHELPKLKHHPKRLEVHEKIFIGHTSTVFDGTTEPINAVNLWNVDTGGGWHGKLTIMDIDTEEYWQSDLVKDLYPNQKRR